MLWPDYHQWPKGETYGGSRCCGLSIGFGSLSAATIEDQLSAV
jgi:hypothetical protein